MSQAIGLFGDSYCAVHKVRNLVTYIEMLEKHYSAEITHLGKHGASIGHLYLKQLQPVLKSNNIPDVCIFVWTDPSRLYAHDKTGVGLRSSMGQHTTDLEFWDAANKFFTHLYIHEWAEIQYTALCHYIDNEILSKFPSHVKVIHLWSFGSPNYGKKTIEYHYTWKNGMEIRPPLATVSALESDINTVDTSPNHLNTQEKNDVVFEWIKSAIDNYEFGK